jgi:hypothetical protein
MRIICGRDTQYKDMLPLTGRRRFLFILLTQRNMPTQRNIPTQGITLSGFYHWARLFCPFRAKTCIELNDKNAMKNESSGCKPIII